MAEASGWIVAALVAAMSVAWEMLRKARAEALKASVRAESDLIVKAQRVEAIKATRVNVEEVSKLVAGDDPEGKIAGLSNESRATR